MQMLPWHLQAPRSLAAACPPVGRHSLTFRCLVARSQRVAYILTLGVLEPFRRAGVAGELLAHAVVGARPVHGYVAVHTPVQVVLEELLLRLEESLHAPRGCQKLAIPRMQDLFSCAGGVGLALHIC